MAPAALSSHRNQSKNDVQPCSLSPEVFPRKKAEKKRFHGKRVEDMPSTSTLYANKKKSRYSAKMRRPTKGAFSGDDNISVSEVEEDNEDVMLRDFESLEDSDDDQDSLFINKRNPHYRIVTVGTSGCPTEVFRTDRIHLLRTGHFNREDSDDDCGPNNGLLKLTDRWREEWNHGVQVPVNARDMPDFETGENDLSYEELPPFIMPAKYIGIEAECSITNDIRHPPSPAKFIKPETHRIDGVPRRFYYQADRMDEIWIDARNKKREVINQTPIDLYTFVEIMDTLEIQCYQRIHEELLAPLQQMTVKDGVDEEAACDVCGLSECENDDGMVFCDGCNMCVHLSCYGLEEAPQEEWHCMRCVLSPKSNPPCLLCPIQGGAMKCTEVLSDGRMRWAHISCALWIPECKFSDPEKREPITAINDIPDDRWRLKCSICDTRQGACIQCCVQSCNNAFHVGCGMRSGLDMWIDSDDPEGEDVRFRCICKKCSRNNGLPERKRTDNQELTQLQENFFLFVDERSICEDLGLDRLTVSDVYEYWKLKRNSKGGAPLVRDPQDDIPISFNPQSRLIAQNRSEHEELERQVKNRRRSWLQGRDLIVFVLRREKKSHELLQTDYGIVRNVLQHLISPVPLSDRATNNLVDALNTTVSPEWIEQFQDREDDLMEKEGEEGCLTLTPSTRSCSSTPVPVSRRIRSESKKAEPPAATNLSAKKQSVSPGKITATVATPVSTFLERKRLLDHKSVSNSNDFHVNKKGSSKRSRLTSRGSDMSEVSVELGSPPSPTENRSDGPKTRSAATTSIKETRSAPLKRRRTLSSVHGFVESIKHPDDFVFTERDTPSPRTTFSRNEDLKSIARSIASMVSPVKTSVKFIKEDSPISVRITRSHRLSM